MLESECFNLKQFEDQKQERGCGSDTVCFASNGAQPVKPNRDAILAAFWVQDFSSGPHLITVCTFMLHTAATVMLSLCSEVRPQR